MKKVLKIAIVVCGVLVAMVSCYKETPIKVKAEFTTTFVNDDESVPVKVSIRNKTENADTYVWTFEGASPATSNDKNPSDITYEKAGTYTIKLEATNVDNEKDVFEKQITVVEGIDIQFTAATIQSNYPPVEVALKNTTVGNKLTYKWTFEGGTPATSTEKNPTKLLFKDPGKHAITLEVFNGVESFKKDTVINVLPNIKADFDWQVNFFDDDYQAPVTIQLKATTTSVTNYEWAFKGGTPSTSTEQNPKVTFKNEGEHLITLRAYNDKNSKEVRKTIKVYPNANLRIFNDVKLGINTAHNNNTVGAFFSSELRKTLTAGEVSSDNSSKIDLVFLGLNNTFNYNKFVSPAQAGATGFVAIPNGQQTKIINKQEDCNCGVTFSVASFNAMVNDTPLQSLTITETANGLLQFTNAQVPRIVLFQTADGRKGAVKIKDFVNDTNNSYILCDIKVQKLP